jgi:NFU1 iron-sulfur cluster scaffold homolog, mitochondrial
MTEVVPEPTPNPNAVKFTLDRPATAGRSQTFRAGSDPAESPLGARIFALDGVTNVFMTANFVSVTKEDDADWNELVPRVIDELQAHFAEAG